MKLAGEVSEAAIDAMTTLNADASWRALAAGIRCAAGVTGFGPLGHLFKLARASGVPAVVDHMAVQLIEGTRAAAQAGPHARAGAAGIWNGCSRILMRMR